jgi:hypothetical protein
MALFHGYRFSHHYLHSSWLWELEYGGDEMNEQFNKFKHDAISHLNRCNVARCFHAVLIIRTGQDDFRLNK